MRSIHMHDTEQNINYIMVFEAQKWKKNTFLCGKFVNVCLVKVEHQNVSI